MRQCILSLTTADNHRRHAYGGGLGPPAVNPEHGVSHLPLRCPNSASTRTAEQLRRQAIGVCPATRPASDTRRLSQGIDPNRRGCSAGSTRPPSTRAAQTCAETHRAACGGKANARAQVGPQRVRGRGSSAPSVGPPTADPPAHRPAPRLAGLCRGEKGGGHLLCSGCRGRTDSELKLVWVRLHNCRRFHLPNRKRSLLPVDFQLHFLKTYAAAPTTSFSKNRSLTVF